MKAGDNAVFRLAPPLSKDAKGRGLAVGFVAHSALVMQVRGKGREVELLEKKGPGLSLATRTVNQVIQDCKKKGNVVKVHYLRPKG